MVAAGSLTEPDSHRGYAWSNIQGDGVPVKSRAVVARSGYYGIISYCDNISYNFEFGL